MKKTFTLCALAAAITLQGCSGMTAKTHHNDVSQRIEHSNKYLPKNDLGLVRTDGWWLGEGNLVERKPDALTRAVGSPGLRSEEPQTIVEFARAFSEHAGIRIEIDNNVLQPRESTGGGSSSQPIPIMDSTSFIAPQGPDGNFNPHMMGMMMPSGGNQRSLPQLRYSLTPTETIEAALNRVVASHGFGWRYDRTGDRFIIHRYETATFDLPLTDSMRSTSMNLASGETSASISRQQSPAQNLLETVRSLMSSEGEARLSEAGTLLVSDVPSAVSVIREYVDNEIKKMSRQVMIEVRLFTFDQNDKNEYELNWDLVYGGTQEEISMSSMAGMGVTGGRNLLVSAISPTSRWQGTELSIDALAQSGGISVAYENNFLTLSGSVVTASEIHTTAYLKSVSSSEGGMSDRITATLEPGEVDTGLSLYLHPLVTGDDIVLGIGFSHKSLIGMNSEESQDSRITTPETSGRDTSQNVRLKNGGAVALSGFYVTSAEDDRRGVGRPGFRFLGGGFREELEQRRAVLVIQARIVE